MFDSNNVYAGNNILVKLKFVVTYLIQVTKFKLLRIGGRVMPTSIRHRCFDQFLLNSMLCILLFLSTTEAKDEGVGLLGTSKKAMLSTDVFPNFPEMKRAALSLENYIPISSREFYRGEYKTWPSSFDTFLLRMKLPVLKLVKFILHTRKSPEQGEELDPWKLQTIKGSSWNSSEKVKILIHGYHQNAQTENMPLQLLKAYQRMNLTANILLVDWEVLAAQEYFESAMYAVNVGRTLAEFLLVMRNQGQLPSYISVHMIGFCLGAHIAAAASYHLKQRVGSFAVLGRITGLDPSGPGFYDARHEISLDARDADFVDVIHTNGGFNFQSGELGIPKPVGHVDFYPNGGLNQPICDTGPAEPHKISACNHLKAPDYYKRSIAEELFRACRCENWSAYDTEDCQCVSGPFMGEHLQKTFGKFYLHVFEYTLFEMFEQEGLMR